MWDLRTREGAVDILISWLIWKWKSDSVATGSRLPSAFSSLASAGPPWIANLAISSSRWQLISSEGTTRDSSTTGDSSSASSAWMRSQGAATSLAIRGHNPLPHEPADKRPSQARHHPPVLNEAKYGRSPLAADAACDESAQSTVPPELTDRGSCSSLCWWCHRQGPVVGSEVNIAALGVFCLWLSSTQIMKLHREGHWRKQATHKRRCAIFGDIWVSEWFPLCYGIVIRGHLEEYGI